MGFFGDIKDAKFWRQIATRRDAIFQLKDTQAMEDALNAGRGLTMQDLQASEIKRYVHTEANAEWIFFKFSGKQDLFLMVRVVNDDADAYVMFCEDPDGVVYLDPGNRQDMIDREWFWLFDEPEDPDDFVPAELDWTPEFVQDMPNKAGEEIEGAFGQEDMGTQYTEAQTNPRDPVLEGVLCGITEFFTEEDVDNPQFVVVEEGVDWDSEDGTGKPEGGYCTFYIGCPISAADIEVSLP